MVMSDSHMPKFVFNFTTTQPPTIPGRILAESCHHIILFRNAVMSAEAFGENLLKEAHEESLSSVSLLVSLPFLIGKDVIYTRHIHGYSFLLSF